MIELIQDILKQEQIDVYHIRQSQSQSAECFFVRKKLDLKRCTDICDYTVTVFRPFETDGKSMLGSSSAQIYPDMPEEEIRTALKGAYYAASFVTNAYYELPSGEKKEMICAQSGLASLSMEEILHRMTEALYAEDTREKVLINSAELFVTKAVQRMVNSNGIDVSYESLEVKGEYVVQCTEPQDVETYHSFTYRDLDTEALRADVKEALEMTEARAQAVKAPKAGEYRLILSGEQMHTFFCYYLWRADSSMIYQEYSNFRQNMPVQGEEIQGDSLTILLKAQNPYSPEGIPMKDRVLMENGTLKTIHGGARFAYYLGIEPTGSYECLEVPAGDTPLAELKSQPYLHVVSFSDFQMDDMSGYFGGEIRLAFLYDGQTITPVTGGSVNGNIMELQSNLKFSRERYKNGRYEGPFAVCIEGMKVAGE